MICPKYNPCLFLKSDESNKEITQVYFGSTSNLNHRWNVHLSNYKLWKKGKAGKCTAYILFDIYGVENCTIIILEEFLNMSKHLLKDKEFEYIEKYKCVNKNKPNNFCNNSNYNKDYAKVYYLTNGEYCKQYKNFKLTCVCCHGKFTRANKAQHFKTKKHLNYLNHLIE